MNELKERFDKHIFRHNPFDEQMKDRIFQTVLNSKSASKRKMKIPRFALAVAACIILIFAVTALHGSRLFSTGSQLEQLAKQDPKVEKQLDKLTPEFRKNIKLPTYIPFRIKKTAIDASIPTNNDLPTPESVTVTYLGDGKQFIQFGAMYMPHAKNVGFSNPHYIKLANGTKANLTLNENAVVLHWFDRSTHIDYSIMIMVTEGENPYGKQVLLKIANSMR